MVTGIKMCFRAALLSKILTEQASPENRADIQRSYDTLRQLVNAKSDIWILDNSFKIGAKNETKESEKKDIVERLVRLFEKRIRSAGIEETYDRTDEEMTAMDAKFKVRNLGCDSLVQCSILLEQKDMTLPNPRCIIWIFYLR